MQVNDLVKKLAQMDGNAEVVCALSSFELVPVARVESARGRDVEADVGRLDPQELKPASDEDPEAERVAVIVPVREARDHRLANWDRQWLEERYWDDGLTQAEIADLAEVDTSSICRAMKHLGIPTRRSGPRTVPPDCDQLRELYVERGWNLREVAAELEVSREKVRLDLHDCAIDTRPRGTRSRKRDR